LLDQLDILVWIDVTPKFNDDDDCEWDTSSGPYIPQRFGWSFRGNMEKSSEHAAALALLMKEGGSVIRSLVERWPKILRVERRSSIVMITKLLMLDRMMKKEN